MIDDILWFGNNISFIDIVDWNFVYINFSPILIVPNIFKISIIIGSFGMSTWKIRRTRIKDN